MGISKHVFYTHYKSWLDQATSILELGAQHFIDESGTRGYFKNLFPNYPITCIDLNGENGSLRINLAMELTHTNRYDVITNGGTTEHVSDQYQCWKNIHTLLKPNGIVISEVPEKGSWKGHCQYYVDYSFFKSMSNDFEIVDYRSIYYPGNGYLSFSILQKMSSSFTTNKSEFESTIMIDSSVQDLISV